MREGEVSRKSTRVGASRIVGAVQLHSALSATTMLYAMRSIVYFLLVQTAGAFAVAGAGVNTHRSRSAAVRMNDDPIGSPLIKAINALQETLQQSPIAKFKKDLAKLQAGNYDEAAVQAKLTSLIADEPAVMFSFTT